MAAVAPCKDRGNVTRAMNRYQYHGGPLTGQAACRGLALREDCTETNSIHHIHPYTMCNGCEARGTQVSERLRSPGIPFRLDRPGTLVLRQAWTRGRLCEPCMNHEIVNFHGDHYIKTRRQAPVPNVQFFRLAMYRSIWTTCKCDGVMAQNYCVEDRLDVCVKIQEETDRIAEPQPATPWLYDLDFDPATGRARRAQGGALTIVRNRRTGNNKLDNACRCGRDVDAALPPPHAPAGNWLHAVLQCTVCSGIVIDTNHPRVTNFLNGPFIHFTRRRARPQPPPPGGAPAPNLSIGTARGDLRYGRPVP